MLIRNQGPNILEMLILGNSILTHVHDFDPYFYVPAPQGFEPVFIPNYQRELNAVVTEMVPRAKQSGGEAVLRIELVLKQSIYGYAGPDKSMFLKIYVRLQSFIATAKRALSQGINVPGMGMVTASSSFESNIPFALRFMIDVNVKFN